MMKTVLPVAALLLGSGFLYYAGGVNALILPVRGSEEDFSNLSLGFLGTGWAIGYVLGCMRVPALVARVGHIRAFGAMTGLASLSILLSVLFVTPVAWILLRSLAGFAFSGAAMIVESWLTEQSKPTTRGRIFGFYTMVNLTASTMGQMTLALIGSTGFELFVMAAIFYTLALFPTAVSATNAPPPLQEAKLDIRALWINSPIAVVAVFLVGISNSAFGTLGAVYAQRSGLELAAVALFMSTPILAGAASQVPVGYLSDRKDRRVVLVGVSVVAMLADIMFIAFNASYFLSIATVAVFGAAIFTMYPLIVAHANDHAPAGSSIKVSGGLLLVFGIGSIVGPLIAGGTMSLLGPYGLFVTTIVTHACIIAYALWRIRKSKAVDMSEKGEFVVSNPMRTTTEQPVYLSDDKQAE